MKLTMWYIELANDADCYSIRERTKKDAIDVLNQMEEGNRFYYTLKKVVVEYADAFDLMSMCSGEGGYYGETVREYDLRKLPSVSTRASFDEFNNSDLG